jgi:3',5'-cyclic AMP phosphodiesterase CpdA
VGDSRGEKNNPGIPLKELRARGIQAMLERKPDFVIMTGDLTNSPNTYDQDYVTCVEELAAGIDIPIFAVPGNHDLHIMSGMRMDGMDYWRESFGPARMAFNFGPYRFVGFNSYNWPEIYRDRYNEQERERVGSGSAGVMGKDEFEWIQGEIAAARNAGLGAILFAHHDPAHMSAFEGDEHFAVENRDKFADFVQDAGVKHYFFGHTHENYTRENGDVAYISTGTVSSGLENGDAWSFRVVDVSPNGDLRMRVVNFWYPPNPDLN